ncbi:ammonium transporter [Avibacterium paragallinarum]|uniref:Ammonium transporter n=1 Tax=Avibacterium paragallinarum TaxID=728 RepID=A0AAE5THS3_AVIPA|nr:ammonium transporter [Avibacterium paragallinarum]MEE3608427.1 ammonium transporter [Avibacterium paragallinarum]MEE3620627.1 ammonium transporter [Avibacterium paragallinarum]MEE3667865.1 ammonium transporter [Avibacterium paragallinarum]MEE3680120.1 ammonium transporter [Avibacterium paragallinarum]MEE4385219.1 ammonium transporter [Avibacterium paragallinarum]
MKKFSGLLTLLCFPLTSHAALSGWVQPFSVISAGDTAWVMLSTILVLFMTIPGLALFYAGMVRKKNILSVMVQSFAACSLIAVIWFVCGYSLAFTPNNAFIGGLDRLFLHGLNVFTAQEQLTVYPGASTIPESVFMLFQMAFAIIAGAIMTGAFAERMKFSAVLIFVGLWTLLVYVPTAHWVWGIGGWLAEDGVLDYAGGTVIHINAGVAGLCAAMFIGKRIGYGKDAMPPYNLTLTLIGCAMLWIGWFGFNAGSALAADSRAGMAMVTTQISAAVGALAWILCEACYRHKPSALGLASGAVAGLVGITPAAGFVDAQSAVFIGFITCVICFFSVTKLKYKLGYDDSLDAFGIHGIGGIVGAVLTGIFVSADITGSEGASLWIQIESVLITLVYSSAVSFALLWGMSKFMTLRVERDEERQGLDLTSHGERLE